MTRRKWRARKANCCSSQYTNVLLLTLTHRALGEGQHIR